MELKLALPRTRLQKKPPLNTYLPQERYSEMEAWNLCLAIMYAIHHVHSKKVVHRDIKSGSFVFANPGEKGSLRLTGFGAACSLDDGLVVTPVGSGELVAPEILKEEPHGTVGVGYFIRCKYEYPRSGVTPSNERGVFFAGDLVLATLSTVGFGRG